MHNKIKTNYFLNPNVSAIAANLLGKILCSSIDNQLTKGIIVETEAYCGATDRACHAYEHKRTKRTAVMYKNGGIAYVYLVYGMHHLFNIVTNTEGRADAVLVRAIEPVEGLETMQIRRGVKQNNKLLTGGPARLSQALGITIKHNKTDLQGNMIWLENGRLPADNIIASSPRIGVDYAREDALLPWRFYIKGNKYVSK